MAREYTYARDTTVPVLETVVEIRRIIIKYGGEQFVNGQTEDRLLIGFTKECRQVRFQAPQVPDEQRNKALARALLLVIKAKLEAVASGVVVFEDEFLGNIALPDGRLVSQQVRPALIAAYEGREMPPLLPDYSGDGK